MLASYHNHTYRCKHATGTEEEYILHAIKHGYSVFGFSDHAPHGFNELLSESRMSADEIFGYVETLSALKDKYQDKIDIKIGLELEYYPYYHKTDMELYKKAGIEYFILGQHVVGYREPDKYLNSFAITQRNEDYTLYVDQCIEAMDTGVFSYFAHPDVFKYQGDNDFYREESDRLIKKAVELDIPLEVNMFGLVTDRHYPNPLFWERASRLGAKIIIGRDAHSIERVHKEEEFSLVKAFLKKHHLNNLIDTVEFKKIRNTI